MTLILVRAENQSKIKKSLADVERHAGLRIIGHPRVLKPRKADETAQKIIREKLRFRSKKSVLVRVDKDTTTSIRQIRKIHPPAHLVVISSEYPEWEEIENMWSGLPPYRGYYSSKKSASKKK